MSPKRALVVDDSKTARMVMAKRLREQGLEVDTVESAGAAIDYLCDHIPNVIFMDYQMPGMDGFQALKAIKSNPDTAMIPVLMYTSQENDLQVSQARALGAVDVLPKTAEAKDLKEILRELRLLPGQEPPPPPPPPSEEDEAALLRKAPGEDGPSPPADEAAMTGPAEDLENIAQQAEQSMKLGPVLRRLLGQYHRILRHEMSKQFALLKDTVERQSEDLHRSIENVAEQLRLQRPSRWRRWTALAGFLLLFLPLLLLYRQGLNLDRQRAAAEHRMGRIEARLDRLAMDLGQRRTRQTAAATPAAATRPPERVPDASLDPHAALQALQWALNRNGRFPYGEKAFDETRIPWVSALLSRLAAMHFHGKVKLTAHLGRFCVVHKDGLARLAPPDTPIDRCQFEPADAQTAREMGAEQSIAFSNFLATAPALADGDIQVEIDSAGIDSPAASYPDPSAPITAAEWNRIARRNQRIEVTLIPVP